MSSRVELGAFALAVTAATAAAVACATAGTGEPEEPGRDAMVETIDSASDVGAPSNDAGPCAASGLCTVAVPIDDRINLTSVSGSGPNDVWAVGTDRTILHYDGSAWEKAARIENDAASFTMRAVWAGGPNDIWIGDGPALRHTTGWRGPNATEWTSTTFKDFFTGTPAAIAGKDGYVLIARHFFGDAPALVSCRGWDDAGIREPTYHMANVFSSDSTGGIWSMALTRSNEAWAVSLGGRRSPGGRVFRIYRESEDGGADASAEASWDAEEYDSRTLKHLYGVWGNEAAVWLVGEGGTIRRMTPEKLSTLVFEVMPSPGLADLRGIYGFSSDDIWAVGDGATVLHWDGSAWSKLATPLDATSKPRLFAVWGSGPNDVWIGGHGVMLHFTGKTP